MKRKSVLIALAAISLMALVGLTNAEFSDTEESGTQSVSAGTLDLDALGTPTQTGTTTLSNLAPGSNDSFTLDFTNSGSIDAEVFTIDLITTGDDEVSCTEPEADDADFADDPGEDDCAVPGDGGELDEVLSITVTDEATNVVATGNMDDVAAALTAYSVAGGLDAGETETLTISWSVPTSAGNEIQSDSITFSFSAVLEQLA